MKKHTTKEKIALHALMEAMRLNSLVFHLMNKTTENREQEALRLRSLDSAIQARSHFMVVAAEASL